MTLLQQFNSMIKFYCSAHSGNAEVEVFNNNDRTITHVRHADWKFTVKVSQLEPTAELSFINKREDTVNKHYVAAPHYTSLLPKILTFHYERMSEVE